jgi:hypothetical protein
MYPSQWPSANPILMSSIPYAGTRAAFFDAVSDCFGIAIRNLRELHEECETRPGALNQVYACAKPGVIDLDEGDEMVDPRDVWSGKVILSSIDRRTTWATRRRLIAFMHVCKKFNAVTRRMLSNYLFTFYGDYKHVYPVLCGKDRLTFQSRTGAFLENREKSSIFERIHEATIECVRRGFDNVDFYDQVEVHLLNNIGFQWAYETMQWLRSRKYGGKHFGMGFVPDRPYMCLMFLDKPYLRDLFTRHRELIYDSQYFNVYNVFRCDLHCVTKKAMDYCIALCMWDFDRRFRGKILAELESERFLSLVQQYPQLSKFYTLL